MDSLCVFCGSREGRNPAHREAADALGRELARRDVTLVFGGGGVGLMGVLARAVLDADGDVVGVIPEALRERERPPAGLTELHVVESMHERKRTMFDRSEGFLALAGGLGTLEELFEMLTWAQLGIHDYPVGLLNVDGYYDDLLSFVDGAVADGYVPADHRKLLTVGDTPTDVLDALERYEPAERRAWLDDHEG
jgi:hypothetical protein